VQAGGGSRRLAVRSLFAWISFSYLIGNGDLHGKNCSIRRSLEGSWEVTPAYDLVSTQPYVEWHDPMALNLYGRGNHLRRAHLLESAERLDLPRRAAVGVLDRLCGAAPHWIPRLDTIGFDDRATVRLAELITARLAELGGGG
jgi:serine/threonine-protein kinase HipA